MSLDFWPWINPPGALPRDFIIKREIAEKFVKASWCLSERWLLILNYRNPLYKGRWYNLPFYDLIYIPQDDNVSESERALKIKNVYNGSVLAFKIALTLIFLRYAIPRLKGALNVD